MAIVPLIRKKRGRRLMSKPDEKLSMLAVELSPEVFEALKTLRTTLGVTRRYVVERAILMYSKEYERDIAAQEIEKIDKRLRLVEAEQSILMKRRQEQEQKWLNVAGPPPKKKKVVKPKAE